VPGQGLAKSDTRLLFATLKLLEQEYEEELMLAAL